MSDPNFMDLMTDYLDERVAGPGGKRKTFPGMPSIVTINISFLLSVFYSVTVIFMELLFL